MFFGDSCLHSLQSSLTVLCYHVCNFLLLLLPTVARHQWWWRSHKASELGKFIFIHTCKFIQRDKSHTCWIRHLRFEHWFQTSGYQPGSLHGLTTEINRTSEVLLFDFGENCTVFNEDENFCDGDIWWDDNGVLVTVSYTDKIHTDKQFINNQIDQPMADHFDCWWIVCLCILPLFYSSSHHSFVHFSFVFRVAFPNLQPLCEPANWRRRFPSIFSYNNSSLHSFLLAFVPWSRESSLTLLLLFFDVLTPLMENSSHCGVLFSVEMSS